MNRLLIALLVLAVLIAPASAADLTLRTNTGKKWLLIDVSAYDKEGIKKVEIYINGEKVYSAEKSDGSWYIRYKTELKGRTDTLVEKIEDIISKALEHFNLYYQRKASGVVVEETFKLESFKILLDPGTYTVKAVVEDISGNVAEKQRVVEIVKNRPPTASIHALSSVRTNSNSAKVPVSIEYSDDTRVAKVEVYDGDAKVYETSVNSDSGSLTANLDLAVGSHTLRAKVYDEEQLSSWSDSATVTVVKNQPPAVTLSAPDSVRTATNSAQIQVTVSYSDDVRVSSIYLYVDGSLRESYNVNSKTGTVTRTLTLNVGTHTIYAIAEDNEKLSTKSNTVTVTVTHDNPPEVRITGPSNGEIFWTTNGLAAVPISAEASDDVGVTKVEFYTDGKLIYSDKSSPYGITAVLREGSHTIEAVAYDTMGQSARDSVSVEVRRDYPPTVRIVTPTNGATLLPGAVTITAVAFDDRGISKVEFYVDSKLVGTDSAAPYSVTTALSAGSHTLTAKAYDAAGQTAEDSISVRVQVKPPKIVEVSVPSIGWSTKFGKSVPVIGGEG